MVRILTAVGLTCLACSNSPPAPAPPTAPVAPSASQPEQPPVPRAEAQKETPRDAFDGWLGAWLARDARAIAARYAPDARRSSPTENELRTTDGRAAIEAELESLLRSIPDARMRVARVRARKRLLEVDWALRGRHAGPIFGVPATGRIVAITGTSIFVLDEGGSIAKEEVRLDVARVRRMLEEGPGDAGLPSLPSGPPEWVNEASDGGASTAGP